jgi:hypothetical protein
MQLLRNGRLSRTTGGDPILSSTSAIQISGDRTHPKQNNRDRREGFKIKMVSLTSEQVELALQPGAELFA